MAIFIFTRDSAEPLEHKEITTADCPMMSKDESASADHLLHIDSGMMKTIVIGFIFPYDCYYIMNYKSM